MQLPNLEKIKGVIPLNFALLANPINWVIVALIVALGGVAIAAIITATNASFAQDENSNG